MAEVSGYTHSGGTGVVVPTNYQASAAVPGYEKETSGGTGVTGLQLPMSESTQSLMGQAQTQQVVPTGGTDGGGMGMGGFFTDLGMAIQDDVIQTWKAFEEAYINKEKIAMAKKQFEEDTRRWNLTFAQNRLMANAQLNLQEKKHVLDEMLTSSRLETEALTRQQSEYAFRKKIESDKNRQAIARGFTRGILKSIRRK